MGVEYQHVMFARPATWRPSAERIARFARDLVGDGWVPEPGSDTFRAMTAHGWFSKGGMYGEARKTGARYQSARGHGPTPKTIDAAWLRSQKPELLLAWPVGQPFELGVRYPLNVPPYVREGNYYEIQVHWSRFLIQEESDPGAPRCPCGADVKRPLGGVFGPSPFLFTIRRVCAACGTRVDPSRVRGAARFAIVIDCGKDVPELGREEPVRVHPELRALCERRFRCSFAETANVG